jgi:hypothetical protein
MARRTNDGTTKQTAGEAKARRAPARQRAATKKDAAAASAADMAANRSVGSIERPVDSVPSNDEIARLAYELYLERGGANGNPLEDWYEAERRLKALK